MSSGGTILTITMGREPREGRASKAQMEKEEQRDSRRKPKRDKLWT